MKPTLPIEIQELFPYEIVSLINSYVPRLPKKESISPSLEKELKRIQLLNLKGKNNMYMKDFIDFVLD